MASTFKLLVFGLPRYESADISIKPGAERSGTPLGWGARLYAVGRSADFDCFQWLVHLSHLLDFKYDSRRSLNQVGTR